MKFRRRRTGRSGASGDAEAAEPTDAHTDSPPDTTEEADAGAGEPAASPPADGEGRRGRGPWDASEVTYDEEDTSKVDLGGLVVTGRPGMEVRLQVDEATQRVAAVLLMSERGALEVRAFAAPRNRDIWDDIRKQIAAETARRGGTATEAEGEYGTELKVVMPVKTPEGKSATQPSRVLGIAGPRWLLRATFLGRPAVEPDPEGDLEAALRDVIVVRGSEPMPPGDPLPLTMPGNAQRVQPPPG